MRKRNAFRRSGTKRLKQSASTLKRHSPVTEAPPSDGSSRLGSGTASQCPTTDVDGGAFERSYVKLNRSIEATNLKLAGLADQMATAIEKAGKNVESSGGSESDDNLPSKDDHL